MDFGAVDAATSVVAPDRLPRARLLHRRSPLLGQVVLPDRLDRALELAIDDPRKKRIELARDDGYACFIEEPQTLRDIAGQYEAAGLGHPAHGGGSRIARRADLDGLPGPMPR